MYKAKNQKQKQLVKPQLFGQQSSSLRPTSHYRSMVDLSSQGVTAQKQNVCVDHHYSSVASNTSDYNSIFSTNAVKNQNAIKNNNVIKLHGISNNKQHHTNISNQTTAHNGNNRQPLTQYKDMSNIARIIMGATNGLPKNKNKDISSKSSTINLLS